jgi:phosphatidate cytidylyltransferase
MIETETIKPQKILAQIFSVSLFALSYLSAIQIIDNIFMYFPIIILIVIFINELYRKDFDNLHNLAYTFFGIIYVCIPFTLIIFISKNELSSGQFNPIYLFPFFFLLWSNDTGAYLSGMTFGKHKLFERISPKKTWEGSIGGVIFTLIASYLISIYYTELSVCQWFGYAFIIAVVGTYGDLAESLFKRKTGIKDSGTILPGHGGMLDRFDSALLAAPAIFLYITILEYFIKP